MAKTLVYQLYPLSWRNIKEMTAFLPRIKALGADYVWLSPVYPSPRCDGGYDIADYMSVDRRLGTMTNLDRFIKTAHDMGIGVLMDLVLNHTSTEHKWFVEKPQYYCWAYSNRPGWKNLFNNGEAWKYHEEKDMYYLHLFHEGQADLNWFPNKKLNQDLVNEFQKIIYFWTEVYKIDGFRLDIPQSMNKDFDSEILSFEDLLVGDKAAEVINAVFKGNEDLFLIMECFDPTLGEITDYYVDNTPVDFVLNAILPQAYTSKDYSPKAFEEAFRNDNLMVALESHDTPRFTSFSGLTPEQSIYKMVCLDPEALCIYQGQELGLKNPSRRELPDEKMKELDAMTWMRSLSGESLDSLRPLSRANARVHIPMDEYREQEKSSSSCLRYTKKVLDYWHFE